MRLPARPDNFPATNTKRKHHFERAKHQIPRESQCRTFHNVAILAQSHVLHHPQPSIDRSRYPRPRVAEHGGYGPIPTPPNLHLRRSTEDSPKTEVTTPLSTLQTSTIGEPHIRRRRRKLQNHFHTTKPPSSATNGGFAEHGGCNPSARPPNLRHRRTTHPSPKTEGSAITTSCRWCGRMG